MPLVISIRIFLDKMRVACIQRIISLTSCISFHQVFRLENSTIKLVKQSPVLHIFIS